MSREVYRSRSRQTGRVVILYDRGLDDFEREDAKRHGYEWARWETICEEHGFVCSHLTRKVAESFMAVPVEWCEECAAEAEIKDRRLQTHPHREHAGAGTPHCDFPLTDGERTSLT